MQDEEKWSFGKNESDEIIREYTLEHPDRGERMIIAMMLATSDMQFTREQIRQSFARVNAEGLLKRRNIFTRKLLR